MELEAFELRLYLARLEVIAQSFAHPDGRRQTGKRF
jgi:hypothetical protein